MKSQRIGDGKILSLFRSHSERTKEVRRLIVVAVSSSITNSLSERAALGSLCFGDDSLIAKETDIIQGSENISMEV